MKIYSTFLSVLTILALTACSKDKDEDLTMANQSKNISVSLGGLSTKASDPTDLFTKDTMNVNSVLIYLTDVNGTVVTSRTITKDNVLNSDWYKLTDPAQGLKFVNIPQAVSKVYVYGNPGTAVNNNVISTTLTDQQGSLVLYSGSDDDLTPIENEPINPDPTSGKTYMASVSIAPVVARLQIKSITITPTGSFLFTRKINNVDKTATVSWTNFSADIMGIYMNGYYNVYNNPGNLEQLCSNTTFTSHITNGQWLFENNPTLDAASFASYNKFDGTNYQPLPTALNGKCYAFNFFPGMEVPKLHLDLANIKTENLASTDPAVFNPALITDVRFANVVKYYKDINTEMVASDFKPGTIYNMDIELIPMLDNDLGNIQYNVLVKVSIEPWKEETIIPGFDLEQ